MNFLKLKIILVRRNELAHHFIQRAGQYMVLNADQIKIESVLEMLRGAASAAGPNTTLYAEILEVINDMKFDAMQKSLTAFKAWRMVAGLANNRAHLPGVNSTMTSFMINLKRIGALSYMLVPSDKEDEGLLFQNEKRFNWNMLARSRASMEQITLNPGAENNSMLTKTACDGSIFIFEVNMQGKSLNTNILVIFH